MKNCEDLKYSLAFMPCGTFIGRSVIKVELRMKACLDTFRFLSAEVSWNCQELHYLTSRI